MFQGIQATFTHPMTRKLKQETRNLQPRLDADAEARDSMRHWSSIITLHVRISRRRSQHGTGTKAKRNAEPKLQIRRSIGMPPRPHILVLFDCDNVLFFTALQRSTIFTQELFINIFKNFCEELFDDVP